MFHFLTSIKLAIASALLAVSALLTGGAGTAAVPTTPADSLGAIQAAADFRSSLTSGITAAATTMTLVSTSTPSGEKLTQGATYGFKIGGQEYVVGTLSSGKQITSMTRGISLINGTTTGGTAQAWGRGTAVEITDAPVLLEISNKISGLQYFDNALTYAQTNTIASSSHQIPDALFVAGFANVASTSVYNVFTTSANTFSGATSTVTQGLYDSAAYRCQNGSSALTLCDKAYVDSVAVAGASNADTSTKGIVQQATNAQVLTNSTDVGSTGAIMFVTPSALNNYTASTTYFSTTTTANMGTTSIRSFELPTQKNLRIRLTSPNTVGNGSTTDPVYIAFNYIQDSAGASYTGANVTAVTQTDFTRQSQALIMPNVGSGGVYDVKQKAFTLEMTNASGSPKYATFTSTTFGTSTNGYHTAQSKYTLGDFVWASSTKAFSIDIWYGLQGTQFGTSTRIEIEGY